MAEDERDAKVTQRYRELGGEEPARELDAAILAASRRAVDSRPAPLVAPTGRRGWYVSLAAAAILVLAVAVTVHVERQSPDAEVATQGMVLQGPASTAPAPTPAPAPAPVEVRKERARAAPEAGARRDEFAPEPSAKPAAPPLAQAPARAADAQGTLASAPRAARAMSENVAARLMVQADSPEQALQGIADLRRQGRHDEADKALAEFRKRYPDYRIPPEMLEKVERR